MVEESELTAFPNPFSDGRIQVVFRVPLGTTGDVNLGVYDVTGRHIVSLESRDAAGSQRIATWSGIDDSGERVAPGTYFLRLTSSHGEQVTERVTIVR